MEITVEHLGAVQFEIKARSHTLISDQPASNGGFDEGMTPPELLLASLGSCAAYYAAEYLSRRQITSKGTKVRVTAAKAKHPARMDNFRIELKAPVALSEQDREGVIAAMHRCLIHTTLLHPPQIEMVVKDRALSGV
jgi:putative redox protein